MLGTIRFFLAFFVLISHFPNNGMKLNLGIVSVICFYFISGFLMNKSYSRFVKYSKTPVIDFYIDRAIKLFPQYILVVAATFISLYFFGSSDVVPILNQEISFSKVLANIALLPTNYVFPPLSLDILEPHPIIPPAWSLSTEFHFYLLLPAIFLLRTRFFIILLLITLTIQFSSFFFGSGSFNSNNFGYRYIFGVLTIFLYGIAFSKKDNAVYKSLSFLIWLCFATFLFIISPALNIWANPRVQEVLFGGFLALPLGYYFTSVKVELNSIKHIDKFLGNLAYPMFISHYLSFYLIEKVFNIDASGRVYFYATSILLCLVISNILSVIQKYIESYRLRRRGFDSLMKL